MTNFAMVDIPANAAPYYFGLGPVDDARLEALAGADRQASRAEEGATPQFHVVRFHLRDAVSELGRLELDVVTASDQDIDPATVVGKEASFAWACGTLNERSFRYYHGIIQRFSETGSDRKATFYHVTVVPRAWRLSVRTRSRIFQNLSVAEIVEKVLKDADLAPNQDFRLNLANSYVQRKYCVQYRESEWNFICRLLEEEGIYFWFEHQDGRDCLMIADAPTAHEAAVPYDSVVVQARSEQEPAISLDGKAGALEERIQSFRVAHSLIAGAVQLRDYDFQNSNRKLTGDYAGSLADEPEVYDYPGGFYAPDRASSFAKVRQQEIEAGKVVAFGRGDFRSLAAGRQFSIVDHPRAAYNRGYVCIEVNHGGFQRGHSDDEGRPVGMGGTTYENEFVCIPDDAIFRPRRATPKPVISGVQTAKVVGPAGEEIWTDEFLRIKVQFHWDREGEEDADSSCWVRVAQKWADSGFGCVYLPRIGQEVLVEFVEGDPDRPLVNGCTYNDQHMPPFAMPDKKMQSGVRTNSTPGGGGSNELRFDDSAGAEEIFVHAQKDQNIVVGNDETTNVGHDRTEQVGNNETIAIGVNRTENVGVDETITIGANRTENVGANESITVALNRTRNVGIAEMVNIGAAQAINVGAAQATTVGAMQTNTIGASQTNTIGANQSSTIGANRDATIGANDETSVGANQSTSVSADKSTTVAKNYVMAAKLDLTAQADKNVLIDGGDQVTIQSGKSRIQLKKSGDILIEGSDITVKASGKVVIKANEILEN